MCGIAAIIGASGDHNYIFTMTRVQAHRGPDDHGHLFIRRKERESLFIRDEGDASIPSGTFASFGHLRLSVLDTSTAGRQPMTLIDGRDWISYNGEVYNFVELRAELEAIGCRFRTSGDTEVILAAYRQWGTDCFARFNGMWSLIIWDGEEERIIVSRDRFGVKPLHYTFNNGVLYFASEIKGLLAGVNLTRKANVNMVMDYLKFGTVNHTNATFFDGIEAFPPGHFAIIDPQRSGAMTPVRFWNYTMNSLNIDAREAATEFTRLLTSAVNLRMRSDVPVGACLSGGLDSSAIVCLAANRTEEKFHTFTSCFDDRRFDERQYAQLVNDRMGTVSHMVMPDSEVFLNDLPNLINHQEEPFTTASIYAQYCIMRAARAANIPVLLDGQGADEALCGYRKFTVYFLQQLVRERRFGRLATEIRGLLRRGDRGLLNFADARRYLPASLQRTNTGISRFLKADILDRFVNASSSISQQGDVAARQRLDIDHFSVPSLLRYEDRNSMAFSIESRVPFLDYRLVDWALQLPAGIKIAGGQTKAVLRNAMRDIVPNAVLDRRDKMGFVTPQQVWMKGKLGHHMEERFRSPEFRIEGWMNGKLAGDAVADLRNGKSGDGDLMKLFLLDQWAENFNVQI